VDRKKEFWKETTCHSPPPELNCRRLGRKGAKGTGERGKYKTNEKGITLKSIIETIKRNGLIKISVGEVVAKEGKKQPRTFAQVGAPQCGERELALGRPLKATGVGNPRWGGGGGEQKRGGFWV